MGMEYDIPPRNRPLDPSAICLQQSRKLPSISLMFEFGHYITEHNANTSLIASVRCQLCVYFGKEDHDPERAHKCKKMEAIMSWQGNFRPDLYQHHHMEQHSGTWERYKASSYDKKAKFFDDMIPFKSTIPHHFSHSAQSTLSFLIHAPIIDVIIMELFFNASEQGGTLQQHAMKLFT